MKEKEAPLAFLLRLNLEMGSNEASGKAITPPGRPASAATPGDFLSENCLHTPSQAQ
jgi:hypothetical protein